MAEQGNKMMVKVSRLTPGLATVMDHFNNRGQGRPNLRG